MIVHVVTWRLKPEAHGLAGPALAAEAVRRLKTLEGVVPGLLSVESGAHMGGGGPAAADLALVMRFADADALARYRAHPAHAAVRDFIHAARETALLVDFVAT